MHWKEQILKMSRRELQDLINELKKNVNTFKENPDYKNLRDEIREIANKIDSFSYNFPVNITATIQVKGTGKELLQSLTHWRVNLYPTYQLSASVDPQDYYNIDQNEQLRAIMNESIESINPFCFNKEAKAVWDDINESINKWYEKVKAFAVLNNVFVDDVCRMIGEDVERGIYATD